MNKGPRALPSNTHDADALVREFATSKEDPVKRANVISNLMQHTGCKARDAAIRLGLSRGSVSRLLTLRLLPKAILERVTEGALAASTAYFIASRRDSGLREQLVTVALTGRLSRSHAELLARNWRNAS